MSNKRYLCHQLLVMKKEQIGEAEYNINMQNLMRNVAAKSEQEAINKFINQTNHIKAVEKLEPGCFLLNDLARID